MGERVSAWPGRVGTTNGAPSRLGPRNVKGMTSNPVMEATVKDKAHRLPARNQDQQSVWKSCKEMVAQRARASKTVGTGTLGRSPRLTGRGGSP